MATKRLPAHRSKRPVGRPPAELSERIQIRLSPAELSEWTELARADGRTLSAWIRQSCKAAATKALR